MGHIYSPYRNQTFFSTGSGSDVKDRNVPVTFSHFNVE